MNAAALHRKLQRNTMEMNNSIIGMDTCSLVLEKKETSIVLIK